MIFLYAILIVCAAAAAGMVVLLVIDFAKEELELRSSHKRMDAFNHSHSL